MSVIALAMNLLLAILLVAALVMGWRLERRLRAVRDSHQVFTRAVGELDGATARAHAGLAELRAATDEAIDLLGGRIARAREAADRLDQGLAETETMLARMAMRPGERTGEPRRTQLPAPGARIGLLELNEPARAPATLGAAPRPAPVRARPRPEFEDDLFEDAGGPL